MREVSFGTCFPQSRITVCLGRSRTFRYSLEAALISGFV